VIQTAGLTAGGQYGIVVGGKDVVVGDEIVSTFGAYTLTVILNAAAEDEAHDDSITNDSIENAQNIDGSFIPLGESAERGAVMGHTESFSEPATPYASTDVGQKIRSPKTITSELPIPDSLVVGDVNVVLDITHTWDADLDVFLISPSGTRVELFTSVGGSGDNFIDTRLDDEADTSITSGSAPFTGSFRPEGFLGDFDGEDAQGTWTLEVTDTAAKDSGILVGWSLEVTHDPLTRDYYEFSLNSGQRTTIALSTAPSGGVELRLRDAADPDVILATGGSTSANADLVIDKFLAEVSGTYVIEVLSNTDYRFVVTRDAVFDLEGNSDFASAQDLAGLEMVLGHIGSDYTVTSGALNLLDAQAEAAALGGHLASYNSRSVRTGRARRDHRQRSLLDRVHRRG
jgi:subtilisin-like proprotein convertase family protein